MIATAIAKNTSSIADLSPAGWIRGLTSARLVRKALCDSGLDSPADGTNVALMATRTIPCLRVSTDRQTTG